MPLHPYARRLGNLVMEKWKMIVALIVPFGILLVLIMPWWWNRFAFIFQMHIIHRALWVLPDKYSGIVLWYNKSGGVAYKEELLDGMRNGLQISYDDFGNETHREEYKNDLAWNGFCHYWRDKAWIAEFRDGKLYNGECFGKYAVNGVEFDADEYKSIMKIPAKAHCVGLHYYLDDQIPSNSSPLQIKPAMP